VVGLWLGCGCGKRKKLKDVEVNRKTMSNGKYCIYSRALKRIECPKEEGEKNVPEHCLLW